MPSSRTPRAGRANAARRRSQRNRSFFGGAAVSGVAVVTGAGRGIGKAIADALGQAGFAVARVSLEDEPEGGVSNACGAYCRCDVADIEGHHALLDRIAADLGEPNCLVNNAGVTSLQRGDLLD